MVGIRASGTVQDTYKPQDRVITINNQEYEIPTEQAIEIINSLIYAWVKLGKPQDLFSESGKKLMTVILATWEDTYPQEYRNWKIKRDEYQSAELDIHTQVKQETGRSLASVPYYIYILIKKFFPNQELNREFYINLAREWPIFRFANKI